MSLESLAEIFGLAPLNDPRELTLSCARCLSQITASETDGRVRFTCDGGCTEDELMGALAGVEPRFADWWLNGGITDENRATKEDRRDSREPSDGTHPDINSRRQVVSAGRLPEEPRATNRAPEEATPEGIGLTSNDDEEVAHNSGRDGAVVAPGSNAGTPLPHPVRSGPDDLYGGRHLHRIDATNKELTIGERPLRADGAKKAEPRATTSALLTSAFGEAERATSAFQQSGLSLSNGPPEALERPESHDSEEEGGDYHNAGVGATTDAANNARAAGLDEAGGSVKTTEEDENDGRGIEERIREAEAQVGSQQHRDMADNDVLFRNPDAHLSSLETQMPRDRSNGASMSNEEDENSPKDSESTLNGQVGARRPDLQSWKMMLYALGQRGIEELIAQGHRETIAVQEIDAFVTQVERLRNLPKIWQTSDPEGLSETEIAEEAMTVAVALRDHYAPTVTEPTRKEETPMFQCQDVTLAAQSNELYLSRPEVVEKLGYSQSIALMIGAKHHGKTTNIRTLALSVGRGVPIWGRQVTQGPVLYVASDDELASTRYELLHMGWEQSDNVYLANVNPHGDFEPSQFIDGIAKLALKYRAILIVLDMLFDFVLIKNELGYVDTRTGLLPVQTLADETNAWVVGSHHTPKYLNDAHNAANAALGSQGVSARFSPIILTRKWAEGLYTVESTLTRDPRGEMIKPTKIVKNEAGWIETAGEFKEWMKWEIYAQKVLDLFENPQRGLSVFSIAEKLGIDRSRAQNTVKEMEKLGKLRREKQGRSYLYYLGSSNMFEREGGNWSRDD